MVSKYSFVLLARKLFHCMAESLLSFYVYYGNCLRRFCNEIAFIRDAVYTELIKLKL